MSVEIASPQVWECTRLVISNDLRTHKERNECLSLIVKGLVDIAQENGAKELICLSSLTLMRALRQLGYDATHLGQPYRNDEDGRLYSVLQDARQTIRTQRLPILDMFECFPEQEQYPQPPTPGYTNPRSASRHRRRSPPDSAETPTTKRPDQINWSGHVCHPCFRCSPAICKAGLPSSSGSTGNTISRFLRPSSNVRVSHIPSKRKLPRTAIL